MKCLPDQRKGAETQQSSAPAPWAQASAHTCFSGKNKVLRSSVHPQQWRGKERTSSVPSLLTSQVTIHPRSPKMQLTMRDGEAVPHPNATLRLSAPFISLPLCSTEHVCHQGALCFSLSLLGTKGNKRPKNTEHKFPVSALPLLLHLLPRRHQTLSPSSVCKQACTALQDPSCCDTRLL